MGYPFWVTTNNLGTFDAGDSLTLTPITLFFGETENATCSVQLLNGQLPPGVTWSQSAYEITLKGELQGIGETASYTFTFRASNSVYVADRTFQITVSQEVSVFEWVTSNQEPLLYVYDAQTSQAQIAARSVPLQAITYTCTNLNLITQGILLDASSGEFSINLAWKPNTAYTASKDYVFSNNQLYVCIASGVSNTTQGPQLTGAFVVDSAYAPWQPNRLYNQGSVVTNSIGKIYLCIQTGTSGSGSGPSSVGNFISDGSAFWSYQGQALVWNQVPTNTQVTLQLQCVAQAATVINRTFEINLVSREAAPIWLTPAGELLQLTPGQLFSYQLEVQDPDSTVLTWSSVNLPYWITLSITGELFGQAPQVFASTSYTFDVQVTDLIHTVSRTFEIQVVRDVPQLNWVTDEVLPNTSDGVISQLYVQAQSPLVGANITYGWVGGTLPLGLRLDSQTGFLQGFVEFHAQDKLYYFEIQASDGVNRIQQRFQVKVTALNRNIYWTLQIPLWGDTRTQIVSLNNNSVLSDSALYLLNEPTWGRVSIPTIMITSGVKVCAVDEMRLLITNYMHAWTMLLGQLQTTQVSGASYGTLDVQVSDAVAPPLWKPNTSYVINQRVSVGTGAQYQALNASTSGSTPPNWNSSVVQDELIQWQLLSSPNTQSARSAPLPWYAYHAYVTGNTIMRQGITYVCAQPGTSGGTWPLIPLTASQVSDGSVVWNRVATAPLASNTYWPSCVTNMRQVVQQQLGWSTSLGTGAQIALRVDASSGAVIGSDVINSGTGYWHAPPCLITSETGFGAQLQAQVGILRADVLSSDTGVADLAQFELDLGNGIPAQLLVDGVTPFDQAARITVLSPGAYIQIPSEPITVLVGTAKVTLRIQVGVVGVQVIKAGTGYRPSDQIRLTGSEWDPVRYQFVDEFNLNMCVAYVKSDAQLSLDTLSNPYVGKQISVNRVLADVQGLQWQGDTRWDSDTCTWDSDQTRFVEHTTATETVWDQSELSWDQDVTTFDREPLTQYPDISQTIFDADHTLFDYYATVFDAVPVEYKSRTQKSWVWFMSAHE
jgi:hypothetical protein